MAGRQRGVVRSATVVRSEGQPAYALVVVELTDGTFVAGVLRGDAELARAGLPVHVEVVDGVVELVAED